MLKDQIIDKLNYESQIIVNELSEYLELMKYSMKINYLNSFSKFDNYKLFSKKLIEALYLTLPKIIDVGSIYNLHNNFLTHIKDKKYSEPLLNDELYLSLLSNILETSYLYHYSESIKKIFNEVTIYKIMDQLKDNEYITDIFNSYELIEIIPYKFLTGVHIILKIIINDTNNIEIQSVIFYSRSHNEFNTKTNLRESMMKGEWKKL